MIRRLIAFAVLMLALAFSVGASEAATLYISEFASGVGQQGTVTAQIPPAPSLVDQTVAVTGASLQSAAFGANTHAVTVECDADCSVVIGANPVATTTNYLMGDGTPYRFQVTPGQKIAVIANTSGGSGTDVNIAAVGGNAVTTTIPVSGTVTTAATTQLPAALGQTTMAASLPVAIASNQSAIPVSGTVTATPPAFTSITASATGTTAATTATLAGTAAKTTYLCGFTITADATAALAGVSTVTGTITGTLNYIQNVGAATAAGILSQTFYPCVPASAQNTGIAVNSVAAGVAGNTAVSAWGYQQ